MERLRSDSMHPPLAKHSARLLRLPHGDFVAQERVDVVVVAPDLAEPSFRVPLRVPGDDVMHMRDLLEERALPAQYRHDNQIEAVRLYHGLGSC